MPATFDASSTTDEVLEGVDLTGRRVLVTGASAGLGVETVRALTAHGASVVAGVRDPAKATPPWRPPGSTATPVELRTLDLARWPRSGRSPTASSPTTTASTCSSPTPGSWPARRADRRRVRDPVRHQPPRPLRARQPAGAGCSRRPAAASSTSPPPATGSADVDLDDPNFEHRRRTTRGIAYGRSKTANVLFAVELDRRLRDRGVRATAVHPGMIYTELGRHMTDETIDAPAWRHGADRKIVVEVGASRARPRRCGRPRSPTPTRSAAATARTAPSRR